MSHPRIEEVDDDSDNEIADDPDEMDLDAFDFARPQKGSLQQPGMEAAAASQMSPQALQEIMQPQNSATGPPSMSSREREIMSMSSQEREQLQRDQKEKSKHYQCIYPLYFDSARSREDGRRVKKEHAVSNPLAREIVDALQHVGQKLNVGLQIVFEPSKQHPKDWANPGRVRVLVKEGGRAVSGKVKNKHHLYNMIAEYLQQHPTTEESPMRLRLQGMPMPKEKIPPPAVPRGFKINSILPLHSPALSGGGVSDNFLKDMMNEMGGQLPEGMAGMANMVGGGAGSGGGGGGGQAKKVKEKKKK